VGEPLNPFLSPKKSIHGKEKHICGVWRPHLPGSIKGKMNKRDREFLFNAIVLLFVLLIVAIIAWVFFNSFTQNKPAPTNSSIGTSLPGRTMRGVTTTIEPDFRIRAKRLIEGFEGIESLKTGAYLTIDFGGWGKYGIKKTGSDLVIGMPGTETPDIEIGINGDYVDDLERAPDLCAKARELYVDNRIWIVRANNETACVNGYREIYDQCLKGELLEQNKIELACLVA